ncbi:uncharacterized protein LOC133182587 [Saccostrea echinata]|uniref:uncharacterized protein LOC133182587 n=1 Tax=Saccostrea echinata TaxID=191078 RepID=UPI002A7F39B6|nr:uncharacterized protein LOC133182587 [Saccostrea echinata]
MLLTTLIKLSIRTIGNRTLMLTLTDVGVLTDNISVNFGDKVFPKSIAFVLLVAKANLTYFRKLDTNCLFTKEVYYPSRSRLHCATICVSNNSDIFSHRKGECYCVDSIDEYSVIKISVIYPVYVRKSEILTVNFTRLCVPVSNASSSSTLMPLLSTCRVNASIILYNKKLVLFSSNTVFLYDDYERLDSGPSRTCPISDLFAGITGTLDAAYDDNDTISLIQGSEVYTYAISTILEEKQATLKRKEKTNVTFKLGLANQSSTTIDCVIKDTNMFYVFAGDYVYDVSKNPPTIINWKSNSAKNPFKSTNHSSRPHYVDACANSNSQKLLFFSGSEHFYYDFSTKHGFWTERNQTKC